MTQERLGRQGNTRAAELVSETQAQPWTSQMARVEAWWCDTQQRWKSWWQWTTDWEVVGWMRWNKVERSNNETQNLDWSDWWCIRWDYTMDIHAYMYWKNMRLTCAMFCAESVGLCACQVPCCIEYCPNSGLGCAVPQQHMLVQGFWLCRRLRWWVALSHHDQQISLMQWSAPTIAGIGMLQHSEFNSQ